MIFTNKQLDAIATLSDGILPEHNGSPSATQVGVNFIFGDIASSWSQEAFNGTAFALDAIADLSASIFGKYVGDLNSSGAQDLADLVSKLECFSQFWEPFRTLTTLSYYALPPGFIPIGLPGPTVDNGGMTAEGLPI